MSQFKLKIISKLVPGLRKDGYAEQESAQSQSSTSANNAASQANPPPAQPNPQFPRYDPDEEFPFRTPPSHIPPHNPLEIGRRDLDPIPMNPFSPPPLFPPGSGDGDGMFVGPSHPIFNRQDSRRQPFGQPQGPWGGDGFLPPMGAPPGARFDPVGPFGAFPGSGRRLGPGNMPRGAQGRDPDNDEFMPPGMVRSFIGA
jgi:proteasome inhibitor subunit 1 (PI31)